MKMNNHHHGSTRFSIVNTKLAIDAAVRASKKAALARLVGRRRGQAAYCGKGESCLPKRGGFHTCGRRAASELQRASSKPAVTSVRIQITKDAKNGKRK